MIRGFQFVVLLMVSVTSVWAYLDAKSRGMRGWVWFTLSLGMWIFGFPMYLLRRYQLELRAKRLGTPPFVPDVKNDLYYTIDRVTVVLVAGLAFVSLWWLTGRPVRTSRQLFPNGSYIETGLKSGPARDR
jgi:hypothetical protein